jgi:hypothetical protein
VFLIVAGIIECGLLMVNWGTLRRVLQM